MTVKRDLKRIIRARMARTGEPFTKARQHVLRARRESQGATPAPPAAAGPEPSAEPQLEATAATAVMSDASGPTRGAQPRSAVVLEAAVLRRGARSMRVRVLSTGEELTVRARELWHVMPGHVVTLSLVRQWRQRGHVYGAGEVQGARVDVPALGVPPLGLQAHGPLATEERSSPASEKPRATHALEVAPRTAWEMQEVPPRIEASDDASDLVLESLERKQRGDFTGALRALMALVAHDLRCLDAHAHLGNLVFQSYPEHALLHYEIGVAIGDFALGPDFAGLLPWSLEGNRPFLRCLHGWGLSLWRLGRIPEAARVFERLLQLNPADEQQARRCWAQAQAGNAWDADEGAP
ncbi:tetratricopeptide repeat protein [Chondromyces crocatus]|uniref:Uncharacterized protein n=1 Tax=Chondromyces crocatus TaxID=52 RepID=A0A0K1E6V0_CHOCO|nr:tetratricopeptide repeat protein [Chondromyces crocatus]AKT36569.1 uncharacterized protein CMC5_006870 [Chondromyces crocatus]